MACLAGLTADLLFHTYHEVVEPDGIPCDRVLLHSCSFVDDLKVVTVLPSILRFLLVQLLADLVTTVRAKHFWPAFHHGGVRNQTLCSLVVANMGHLNIMNLQDLL